MRNYHSMDFRCHSDMGVSGFQFLVSVDCNLHTRKVRTFGREDALGSFLNEAKSSKSPFREI